jgi:hypothetical protein
MASFRSGAGGANRRTECARGFVHAGDQSVRATKIGGEMRRILASVLVILCCGTGGAIAQDPKVQMPAGPSVPIGCLLSPDCGNNLLVPDGLKKSLTSPMPASPADPGDISCLVKKICSQDLYVKQLTLNEVAASGATVGEFVVTKSHTSPTTAAPASLAPSSEGQAVSARCAGALSALDRTSRSARAAPLSSRHSTLDDLVVAYGVAVDACTPLAR